MIRTVTLAALASLAATSAFASNWPLRQVSHEDYNRQASAYAAKTFRSLAATYAPHVSWQAAENPTGPTLVASWPVPDTPENRARFGDPMSCAGRMTAAIGD